MFFLDPKVPSVMTSASSKTFFHIPHDHLREPLRPENARARCGDIARKVVMQLGSVGLKGIVHVKDRWKDLIFHVDKTKRLFGYLFTGGCHKCDCIAHIADFTVENAKYRWVYLPSNRGRLPR